MYQEVDGVWVEVVDLKTMPKLPITGLTEHEMVERRAYMNIVNRVLFGPSLDMFSAWKPASGKVARALTAAITDGIITEPGKYAIQIDLEGPGYRIAKVIE